MLQILFSRCKCLHCRCKLRLADQLIKSAAGAADADQQRLSCPCHAACHLIKKHDTAWRRRMPHLPQLALELLDFPVLSAVHILSFKLGQVLVTPSTQPPGDRITPCNWLAKSRTDIRMLHKAQADGSALCPEQMGNQIKPRQNHTIRGDELALQVLDTALQLGDAATVAGMDMDAGQREDPVLQQLGAHDGEHLQILRGGTKVAFVDPFFEAW